MKIVLCGLLVLISTGALGAAATEENIDANAQAIASLLLMLANICAFLVGVAFGWKQAARPPVDLMS